MNSITTQQKNANRHTERGMTALERSIQQDGMIGALTVAANGEIFDGSARREVFDALAMDDAIIVHSDGSKPIIHIRDDILSADDPKAVRLGLAANRIAQINLDWSADILAEIQATDAALFDGLFDDTELAEIFADIDDLPIAGDGGDEFDTTPQDGETRCKLGDLWQLGDHRMICGDSTHADTVARLMDGAIADLVFTDPPYGVAYAGGTGNLRTEIANDNLGDDQTQAFLIDAFTMWPLKKGGVFYICAPPGHHETAFRLAMRDAGFQLRQCLAWVKHRFVFGRSDYHYRHESILYGWRDGAAHYFVEDRTQDTVWEFDRPMASPDHPTVKPLGLVERAITNSSTKNQLVYDGFLGSGTTLIACERTNRTCYGLEIDPHYADVILKRWETETGKTAVLCNNEPLT